MKTDQKNVMIKDFLAIFSTIGLLITITFILVTRNFPILLCQKAPDRIEPFDELLSLAYGNFSVPRQGLIHIGARYAEELGFYKKHNIKDILWIEADPTAEQQLKAITAVDPDSKVAIFAATDTNGIINLYRTTNEGKSSSILKLKNHIYMDPSVAEENTIPVIQRRLDDYLKENKKLQAIPYNFIVIDIQGAELIAFKGAVNTLDKIDAIIAEINYDELYHNAVYVYDLDNFLREKGFIRVDTFSCTYAFGNSLYVKEKFTKPKMS